MLIGRRGVVGAFAGAMVPARAAAAIAGADEAPSLIPVEAFAEKPAMEGLVLSPDGTTVLARMQVRGAEMLGTYTVATGKLRGFTLPTGCDLVWYRWAGNDRFVVSVSMLATQRENIGGVLMTVSIQGRATRLLTFDARTERAQFIGRSDASFDGDEVLHIDPAGQYLLLAVKKSYFEPPAVYRYALADNQSAPVERASAGVQRWFADDRGVVRAAMGSDRGGWFLLYRSAHGQPLRRVAAGKAGLVERARTGEPIFVSGTDDGYILSNHETGFYAAYRFNFATQTMGERVFAGPSCDVEALSFSDPGHQLEAIHYTAEQPRVEWMTPLLKEVQAGIDRAMPNRQNRIVSRSSDNGLMLVHSGTTRDPGIYYLFNLATTKLQRLVQPSERLRARDLSTMAAVSYPARDGLTIPGYLTLPSGRKPEGLPLVIMPHGGPYGVRDTLGFQADVQFLANRGYAVLQPNYRGSEGYGIDFFKRGQGEWGRKMQDDLDDGMDWLVRRGIVDARRACLVGGSYGGYAAAWGATRNPDRYRCAACFAGVFDLRAQLGHTRDFLTTRLYREFRDAMRGAETFDLDSVSPLRQVGRLSVPVMLVHGDADTRVPVEQSKRYAAALAKAGKPHEFHVIPGGTHGFGEKDSFAFYLRKLDAFLARHNPGGTVQAT